MSKIRTETPKVAYFSIPFDGGWSASVNGKYTTIYRSGGMMALKLEAGDNTIVFTYEAPGLKTGTGYVRTMFYHNSTVYVRRAAIPLTKKE